MCRYEDCTDSKYLQIHTHTYTYIQYLLIRTYLHIPAIYTYAIPTYIDIPAHTYDTYSYRQYLYIVIYLHIPAIPSNTCNTYK